MKENKYANAKTLVKDPQSILINTFNFC